MRPHLVRGSLLTIIVLMTLVNVVTLWMWRSSVAEYQALQRGITRIVQAVESFHEEPTTAPGSGDGTVSDPLKVMKTVERVAKRARMEQLLTTIEQQGGELALTFEEVRFNSLIGWLVTLEREGVQVISVVARRTAKAGMVFVEVVVR